METKPAPLSLQCIFSKISKKKKKKAFEKKRKKKRGEKRKPFDLSSPFV